MRINKQKEDTEMIETLTMLIHIIVVVYIGLFFAVELIANKFNNKFNIGLLIVMIIILVELLYTITTGKYQSVNSTILVMVIVLSLISRKDFLNNLKNIKKQI